MVRVMAAAIKKGGPKSRPTFLGFDAGQLIDRP
jgi:hypothetical protein